MKPPFYVGLSTLAMGDVCAVEYARCSHVALCIKNQVFSSQELITLRGALPRGLLKAGILWTIWSYWNKLHVPPLSSEASRRASRARMAYAEAKVLHNPKKGFADQYLARFWGIEIDGMKGILRGSSLRL